MLGFTSESVEVIERESVQDRTLWFMLATVILLSSIVYLFWQAEADFRPVAVKLPASFSPEAVEGRELFVQNCKKCHGQNGFGTNRGPPLVHIIYEPRHHSDARFYRAVTGGVAQHHWPYGNMPAIQSVSADEVTKIISYVRKLQSANGINCCQLNHPLITSNLRVKSNGTKT